ncbi:MAG TPA: 4-carboxymuconolactone decarboxylase, partial [Thermoanaerobaculia bacterium]|nr:4-carboxymuconolactone decarboxylase [Thermoanaerobaculia bacterium]
MHYYRNEHLSKFGEIEEGAPELAKKFFDYYSAV